MVSKYLHMMPVEVPLWERFLSEHQEYFDSFSYDVHVGEGIPANPLWPENIKAMAKYVTQKRIDAVGYRKGEVWIIEVKPDAGLSAIGQLLSYKELYIKKHGELKKIYLACVTDNITPDEIYLFKKFNIRYYVV